MKIYKTWEMLKLLDENPKLEFKHSEDDLLVVRVSEHTDIIEYINLRTYDRLSFEMGDSWIIIAKCGLCEVENSLSSEFTKYTEFKLGMYGNEICISDDCGNEGMWKVHYCPICGKELAM